MPQITPYEDEQESVDQSTYDPTMGGHMIPFHRAWAVTGCITWRHNDRPLLTVPFLYTPTPFLPGAMTICDPSLLRPAHPMTDLSPTRQAPPLRTKLGKLPKLPPGDEWVMADHYWRHQLLGWTDGGPNGHPVGVSATTIEVGNLLPDDEDMDNMDLLLYVYRHFRPAGLIRDLWVPAGQGCRDRMVVVVIFAHSDAVGRALGMPAKGYFFDGAVQTISVKRRCTAHSWYPAPRSRVDALVAHAISTRTTPIEALMALDPDLADLDTDHSILFISPPQSCLSFEYMPKKSRPRYHFALDGFEPVPLARIPIFPIAASDKLPSDSPPNGTSHAPSGLTPRPLPELRLEPLIHKSLSEEVIETSGLLPPGVDHSSQTANDRVIAPEPESTDKPRSEFDSRPTKKQRSEATDIIHQDFVDESRSAPHGRLLTEMAKVRLNQLQPGVEQPKNHRKRKAGELDEEDRSEGEGSCDMEMDIDD